MAVLRKTASVRTAFQPLEVWASDVECEFRVAGATHAWWHRDRLLTGLAWDAMAAACLLRPAGPPRSVLMLGLAGGTSLRTLRALLPEVQLTAVEIDPQIAGLGRQWMQLDAIGIEVCIDDAYAWLARNERQFDIVFDDVYRATTQDVVRPGAWSGALAGHLLRAVAPGGLLAANLVLGQGHRTMQTAFRTFFRRQFPAVRSLRTVYGANETLVGGAGGVLGQAGLAPWQERFADARDRRRWSEIAVHRLASLQGRAGRSLRA